MGESAMNNSQLETQHEDMIHDAQLDYYGKRLATCSSDRTIKIFTVEGDDPASHKLQQTLKGHDGPVWQVCWAHPKFGSIIASCSYDSSVNSIAWAPNECGLALAVGSSDCSVSVIHYQEKQGWVTSNKQSGAHLMGCNAVTWAPVGAALGGPAQPDA